MSAQLNSPLRQPLALAAGATPLARQLDEMAALIERFAAGDGMHDTAIPRVKLSRLSQPGACVHGVQEPALGIIAQGSKRVLLTDEVYVYDRATFLVASVDLPVAAQVVGASTESPYLGVRLDLDLKEISSLMLQAELPASVEQPSSRGLFLSGTSPSMVDAVLRLLRLLETPEDIPALAPLLEREVLYRLLKSEQGWRVAQMATVNSQAQRIGKAIKWLKAHFTEPLRIDAFARDVNMSTSSLHHHFKAVTSMSPLQYQKQLRLQEARRLLLGEGVDAATAGHRVGYESPSQFSREYSRLFGAPPAQDQRRLRQLQQPLAAS
jgi:AraC-like DNA-binding protein